MRVAMPLPSSDFDPTESAIPWQQLSDAGHEVVFATPTGAAAHADDRMLTGRGLGPWIGVLRARSDAISAYASMEQDDAFRRPITWAALADGDFDALVLPGGHAPGMRAYLESPQLQAAILSAMTADRPVAAICHGVLLMARTIDPASGRSVLWGRRTTALPRSMEMSAWGMTCSWLGSYYRTYPETVEDEVTRALVRQRDFDAGPMSLLRDAPDHLDRGFFVLDNNYLSARWPGDAYAFSAALLRLL